MYNIDENLKDLFDVALDQMAKTNTGYEKGMLACSIANLIIKMDERNRINAINAIPTKEDLENKPEDKEPSVEFKDLNENAPIAETLNQTTKEALENANLPEENQESVKDWETKILDSTELEDTWTDRMKANKDIYTYYLKLGTFIQKGITNKVFDKQWVNQKASEVTEGKIKDITTDFKNTVTPKLVKMFCAYITDEARRMIKEKNKAA